jgi:hypothetical protein
MVRFCAKSIPKYLGAGGVLWHSQLGQDCFGGRSCSLLTGSALVSFSTVRAEPVLFKSVPSRDRTYRAATELTEPRPLGSASLLQHRVQRALPITFQIDRYVMEAQWFEDLHECLRH